MLLAIDFSWCPLERGIKAPRRCHLQTWLGKDKSVRCSRQTALPGGPSGREWGFLYLAVLIMLPQHGCNIFSGSEQVAHALTCVHWATGWHITILTRTRCTDFQRKKLKQEREEDTEGAGHCLSPQFHPQGVCQVAMSWQQWLAGTSHIAGSVLQPIHLLFHFMSRC